MTREEAIEFIAQSVKSDVDMAKVADAIKALKQEPIKNHLGVEKIIDEVEKEFEKVDIPIMDKLTIFAKVQNALYKCAVSNNSVGMIRPKGHWDIKDNMWWVCSACGCQTRMMKKYNVPNFCPACGADMREVDE